MIKFDAPSYRSVIEGAVGLRSEIERIAREVNEADLRNLFLIGSGGSYGAMLPFERLVQNTSVLPVRAAIAAELVLTNPPALGTGSVAVFSSLSGTTSETVAAAQYCADRGVTTIALTGDAETPLARVADHVLVNAATNDNAAESIESQLLLLVASILHVRGEFPDYDELASQMVSALPQALVDVALDADDKAQEFARKHNETNYHFLVGSGDLWGFTYNYSMCVLEEMQWLHTTRVHGAEFFHGSLELIEKDTSLLLFFGEDETRPLMERVRAFATEYSDNVTVFDTADYKLNGIDDRFRGLLGPVIMGAAVFRLSVHLEAERNHSLDLRRYYRTVKY